MRLLNVVHQYPPEHAGGTELYTRSTSLELARSGHEVSIFYRRDAPGFGLEHRDDQGVDLWAAWHGVASPTRRFLTTFGDPDLAGAFERVLDTSRPDLVHIQHLMGLPVQLIGLVRRRRIPLVVTLHDYWWVCSNAQLLTNFGQQLCGGPRAWLNCGRCALARAGFDSLWPGAPALVPFLAIRARMLRDVLLSAGRVIAPTHFVRDWYAAHGIPSGRLQVLPHGIEPPSTPSPASRPGGILRIACIGGLSPSKGVHILVEAIKGLAGRAELWIAGDESADPSYSRALRARAGDNVRFLGALAHQQVWECLGQVDILAVPSLWYETFSLIAHEAFAARVPVVASKSGALAEVVRDEIDGLLIPPGDVAAWQSALLRLINEAGLLDQLRSGVRPPMDLSEHVRRLAGAYAEVAVRNGGMTIG